jgi:hypothetical protein
MDDYHVSECIWFGIIIGLILFVLVESINLIELLS